MMSVKYRCLPYLSSHAVAELWERRSENTELYARGDFNEQLRAPGAELFLQLEVDLDALSQLNAGAPDLENAKIVWSALGALSPSLARENRVWTRLCHGEALDYSRARWFKTSKGQALAAAVETHMFARTLTQCRDDNALGRLWWTAFVARRISNSDFEVVLGLLLKTADIRSNFVERTWLTARPKVARAIVDVMKSVAWVTASEKNFREVMKALNVLGAGVAFEAMSDAKVSSVVAEAVEMARAKVIS